MRMGIESFLDKHFIGNGDGRIDWREGFEYVWLAFMLALLVGQIRAGRRGNNQTNEDDINNQK